MRQVFQLAPDDDRPFRVGHMMDDDPEETAGAEGEEKGKGEEPRKAELLAARRTRRPR